MSTKNVLVSDAVWHIVDFFNAAVPHVHAADDGVEFASLQRSDDRIPVGWNKFKFNAELFADGVGHVDVKTDDLVGLSIVVAHWWVGIIEAGFDDASFFDAIKRAIAFDSRFPRIFCFDLSDVRIGGCGTCCFIRAAATADNTKCKHCCERNRYEFLKFHFGTLPFFLSSGLPITL